MGFARLASLLAPAVATHLPRLMTPAARLEPRPVLEPAVVPPPRALTPRELDVLRGVAAGHSNKVIARQLHLTPETIKWHLKNIMRKLGVHNRQAAVRRATACGVLMVD